MEVVGVSQACRGRKKRPLVAVADLIETSFAKNEGKFSLMLNADILLFENAGTTLSQERRGVTMIPRWQIDRYESGGEMEKMERDPWGYDGVLLGPELRGVFLNRYFGLGLPLVGLLDSVSGAPSGASSPSSAGTAGLSCSTSGTVG